MSFGSILKAASSNHVEVEVYEKLKPLLLQLANEREKGCKLLFFNISDLVIEKLKELIRSDDILVQQDMIIWDESAILKKEFPKPSPCQKCSFEMRIACCGCSEQQAWKESKETETKTVYDVEKEISITMKDKEISIQIEKRRE
ncbi:MAG: hypothetical protein Q4D02_04025 [Clostridia bacterium]|nr:hypothetical protein [Clostridia bacterium]